MEFREAMNAAALSDDLLSRENLPVVDSTGKFVRQCRRRTVRMMKDGSISLIITQDEAKRAFGYRHHAANGAFQNWFGGRDIEVILLETS